MALHSPKDNTAEKNSPITMLCM